MLPNLLSTLPNTPTERFPNIFRHDLELDGRLQRRRRGQGNKLPTKVPGRRGQFSESFDFVDDVVDVSITSQKRKFFN
jgi:hypothetical protein